MIAHTRQLAGLVIVKQDGRIFLFRIDQVSVSKSIISKCKILLYARPCILGCLAVGRLAKSHIPAILRSGIGHCCNLKILSHQLLAVRVKRLHRCRQWATKMLLYGKEIGMLQPLGELPGILFNLLLRRTREPVAGNQQTYRHSKADTDDDNYCYDVVTHDALRFTKQFVRPDWSTLYRGTAGLGFIITVLV